MNAIDYDFESLAGENLYTIDAQAQQVTRVGYRNGAECISLTKPHDSFVFHGSVPCKGRDGLLTTVGEVMDAMQVAS